MDASGARFAFLPPERAASDLFDLGDRDPSEGEDVFRDDLFETISDAHYLLPPALESHEDELLESLVEKGCEDNQILDRLSAQLSGGAAYGGELPADEAGADLIGRLESLGSPSRNAAQGLLHLARRPSDPFASEAPAPDLPPPEEFRYEDFEELASAVEIQPDAAPAPPAEESPAEAPETSEVTERSPRASPISDLRDIKLDILTSGIDIGFQLDPAVAVPEIAALKEEMRKPADLRSSVPLDEEEPAPPAGLELPEREPAELPRDLSMPRRASVSYASPRRIDIPRDTSRAPSRDSDAMQSPQPSGIPAIASPEVFHAPSKPCRPSPFLESLYASTSPKMYTSEVTIQQCAPLNLGKHRKSASPTVSSCSDDIRPVPAREPSEPQEKRPRREPHDLAKICSLLKKCGEDRLAEAKQRKRLSEIERLPPLKQLELLETNKNFNLPEHMLVPRDRLNNIIAAPGREIPALLMERPQLNMAEILQDPSFIGDPDLMVISLEQIRQLIIHKPAEGARRAGSPPRPARAPAPASPRPATPRAATPRAATLLADELDAASGAAAYQMNWLPAMYLSRMSQLEAVAACSQNAEFLKALGSAGYGGAAGYAGLSQMFHPSRYGLPAVPPVPPLEFAMWQEAMSAMQRQKQPKESDYASKGRRAERTPPPPPGYRGYPPPPGMYAPRAPPPRSPPPPFAGYGSSAARAPEGSPRPRISVKSLQELQHAAQGARRPARRRDEPEVGSTTSAGEPPPPPLPPHQQHPSHPQHPPHPHDPAAYSLWHPLFSNQKGYPSPWSWTTVTATGD